MSHKTDARQLGDQLRREGFTVQLTHGGHWEVRTAGGERVTTFPQTPSDRRWRMNAIGAIRRWKRERGILTGASRLPYPYHSKPMASVTRTRRKQREVQALITVNVVSGDTLSGLAAKYGTSWETIWHANPKITDPNMIYVGEQVVVPTGGSLTQWTPPSAPSSGSSSSSSSSPAATAATFSGSDLGNVPGVPASFAACVAQRESSDNPSAINSIPGYVGNGGGAYGFLQSTWQGMGAITAGYSQPFDAPVPVQKAAFAALYAQDGTQPWSPSDHCRL